MNVEAKPQADASMGELIGQLSAQLSRLVRDEIRLAQKEIQQSVKQARVGAGLFGAAGLLAFFGLASVLAAAIAALALALPVWAAALIVGGALFIAAGVAMLLSKSRVDGVTPVAPESVASVQKDVQELKDARHDRS